MNKRGTGKQNSGSALITVLAVITVIMVVVLSVLAMSYRYYMSESGSIFRQKADEAARSLSEELGDELMKPDFASAEEAEAAMAKGGLWQYVRRNMGPGWGYYDSGKLARELYSGSGDPYVVSMNKAADKDGERRAFRTETEGVAGDEMPETEVVLYWEPGRCLDRMNESKLYVEVSCRMGDHVTRITKRYKLTTSSFPEGSGRTDKPDGYYKYQNWRWTYDGEI